MSKKCSARQEVKTGPLLSATPHQICYRKAANPVPSKFCVRSVFRKSTRPKIACSWAAAAAETFNVFDSWVPALWTASKTAELEETNATEEQIEKMIKEEQQRFNFFLS